jgi:hypothetical protein
MCDRPSDVVLANDAALHQPLPERFVLPVLGLREDGGNLLRVHDVKIDEDLAQAGAARVDAVVVLLPARSRAKWLELLVASPSPLHAAPIRGRGASSISLG